MGQIKNIKLHIVTDIKKLNNNNHLIHIHTHVDRQQTRTV